MGFLEDKYTSNMDKRVRFHNYYILEDGRVFSLKMTRFLKGHIRGGYHRTTLHIEGKSKIYSTHRLVIDSFGPQYPGEGYEVNHLDGNKLNNHISNLQWATRSENISHAYKNGLIPDRKGYNNSNAKLGKDERAYIIEKKSKGFSTIQLAKIFQVHTSTINRILKKGY